ncbi:MAG TPA: peptidylprolyl isomerase [Polyangiaceae bacterium]|nr:peptidylprolyl isomerase [Polyangiaceae bacterium]
MRFAKHMGWLVLLTACHDNRPDASTRTAPAASSALGADRQLLLMAEQRRDSAAIASEALSSRDVGVRRSAARALARIADARSTELLLLALADEDPEVNSWGAYGLGYACRGREPKIVPALAMRAASLSPVGVSLPLSSPTEAIADALGRCASAEAESTLRAWLQGPKPRAEAAALALGRLATHSRKLDDLSLVALLDAADRAQAPLDNALFPLTRLAALNASSAERTRALAMRAIAARAANLEYAVRVLARTGEPGAAALGTLGTQRELEPGLRAQALRELGTLGAAGQKPLWAAFDSLLESTPDDPALQGENYGPIAALLDALSPPVLGTGSKLQALSELAIAEADPVTLKRRKVHLRCSAAALLAGSNYRDPRLLGCDPAQGSGISVELAVLRVLTREKLRGARKKAYLLRARSGDALLREAAIGRLAEHPELSEAYAVLAEALGASAPGVVASAAHLLAGYPERASRTFDEGRDAHAAPKPDPSVIQALTLAYAAASPGHNVELQSQLLDAIGSLQILSLKEGVNVACSSDNPTLREHAQKALRLLGEQARRCDEFKPAAPRALPPISSGRSLLTLETDAGPLTIQLDPSFAPIAVARVLGLAQSGFYDGISVHRVVPGFVAQFGDPGGDGYGGDNQPPLRCETSPVPFLNGSVGVALSGRDTGSSQLFVTLGRYPHLDGQFAWLGQAGPGWDRIAAGDRILRARVSSLP